MHLEVRSRDALDVRNGLLAKLLDGVDGEGLARDGDVAFEAFDAGKRAGEDEERGRTKRRGVGDVQEE